MWVPIIIVNYQDIYKITISGKVQFSLCMYMCLLQDKNHKNVFNFTYRTAFLNK